MSPNKKENTRLDLVKAGKLEDRRSSRLQQAPAKQEEPIEESLGNIKLRPEAIAIALMVVVLLILALVGF